MNASEEYTKEKLSSVYQKVKWSFKGCYLSLSVNWFGYLEKLWEEQHRDNAD